MSGSGSGTPIPVSPTFVFEDGTGKSNANSYLSVDAADFYHGNVTQSAQWAGASLAVKQNALIVAAQYLDCEYGGFWRGVRAQERQARDWPRSFAQDDDGYTYDSAGVPQRLKDACAELALRVVLGDDLLGVVKEPGLLASESVTVGPIQEAKQYIGSRPYWYVYPKVAALVRPLIVDSGRVIRG